jgi:hypothetical protein
MTNIESPIPPSRALTTRRGAEIESAEPLLPQAVRAAAAIGLTMAAEYAIRRLAGGATNGLVRALASRLAERGSAPSAAASSKALAPASKVTATAAAEVTERVVGVGRVVVTEFLLIERRIRRP